MQTICRIGWHAPRSAFDPRGSNRRPGAVTAGAQSLAPKTNAKRDGEKADKSKNLDKDFASIQQVGMAILQVGIGEEAVEEKKHGGRKNQVMDAPPKRAPHARPKKRRDEYQQQEVHGSGAGDVDERLERRLDGQEDIEDAKMRLVNKQQDKGMGQHEHDGAVRRPLMEGEDIESPVRPMTHGAVAK